jgi:hypothetical protein
MNSPATPAPYEDWRLDPQLARDAVAVGDLPLSRVLVMNDANFPWLIAVPRRAGAVEIFDFDEGQRAQLMRELALLGQALKGLTACHKINIAAIGSPHPFPPPQAGEGKGGGNVHVIARGRDDASVAAAGVGGAAGTALRAS